MTQYSVETKDGIFVKDYEFLSFARNMGQKNWQNFNDKLTIWYRSKVFRNEQLKNSRSNWWFDWQ